MFLDVLVRKRTGVLPVPDDAERLHALRTKPVLLVDHERAIDANS